MAVPLTPLVARPAKMVPPRWPKVARLLPLRLKVALVAALPQKVPLPLAAATALPLLPRSPMVATALRRLLRLRPLPKVVPRATLRLAMLRLATRPETSRATPKRIRH